MTSVPRPGPGPGPRTTPDGDRLTVELIDDVARLEQLAPRWDALAEQVGCPGALSGWQLAWWRHLAPPNARLRAVAVHDGDRLAGLSPYAVERTRSGRHVYRLLAAPMTHRVEPIADPSQAGPVARLTAAALADATPTPDWIAFDAADGELTRLGALRAAWPGRPPWAMTERTQPAPYLEMDDRGFDAWLSGKSRNFRQQTRRFRRKLAEAGGTIRMTRTVAELERDLEAFVRLHHDRWDARGGSSLGAGIGAMLRDAGETLLASERFRLWIVEVDGEPVSAQVFIAAGETVVYWNGGFDSRHAQLKPALLGIVAGIEDSFARGERLLDLGGGAHDYKLRLADGDRPLAWARLVPRNGSYPRNRVEALPAQARGLARRGFHQLPPDAQERARSLLARLPSARG